MYTIYLHKFPNGKNYVGVTKTSLRRRWGDGKNYKTCILLNRAIEKYGWENIEHGILDTAETKEDAERKERIYIFLFHSNDSRYGYNILPGGDVSENAATDEMRYKLGNGNRGRHHTEEEKKKISEGVKRTFSRPESNGCIGRRATKSAKRNMSEAQKKRYENNEEERKKCSERSKKRWENEEYKRKMIEVLKKARESCTAESYRWTEERKQRVSELQKGKWVGDNSPCSKSVLQFSKEGVFIARYGSISEAARKTGTQERGISGCCNFKPHYNTAGGYVWKFEK